jgi:hypothetical protein
LSPSVAAPFANPHGYSIAKPDRHVGTNAYRITFTHGYGLMVADRFAHAHGYPVINPHGHSIINPNGQRYAFSDTNWHGVAHTVGQPDAIAHRHTVTEPDREPVILSDAYGFAFIEPNRESIILTDADRIAFAYADWFAYTVTNPIGDPNHGLRDGGRRH